LTRVIHSYGHVILMPVTRVIIIKPRQEGKTVNVDKKVPRDTTKYCTMRWEVGSCSDVH